MSKLMVKHPCWVIGGSLLFCAITTVADYFVFAFTDGTGLEWIVDSDSAVHKFDAHTLALDQTQGRAVSALVQTQEVERMAFAMVFKTKNGGNILEPRALQFIKEMNDKVVMSDFKQYSKLCLSDVQTFPECSPVAVWDPLIDGLVQTTSLPWIGDVSQQEITQVIEQSIDSLGSAFYLNFETGFEDTRQSQYYRAFFVKCFFITLCEMAHPCDRWIFSEC